MNRLSAGICLLLFGLLIGASTLMAQSTGTIIGVVKDPSGAAIPDATVTATNTSTNLPRTGTTGSDGAYRFDAMQPGPYNLTVTKDGFEKSTLTSLTLEVAQTLEANATLQVGSVQQEVSVSAALAPQVNVSTSSLGGLVNSQQIADLPLNGRNFIDLALLQPGVTNNTGNGPGLLGATYFSTNGAPVRSNLTTLDGAPMINLLGSTSNVIGTTLGVDGIQEFRVITNSFGAQYGLSMGSQIVIASKGGTNQFHGDVFDYLRNDDLDSWGYFAVKKPKLVRNNFGGSFGGPIKKNNTFFYAVYEGIRQVQGSTSTINTLPLNCNPNGPGGAALLVTNPCAIIPATTGNPGNPAGTVNPLMDPFISFYPVPNVGTSQYSHNNNNPTSVNYGQIRVDHTFSAKDSMFGRFTIDQSSGLSVASEAGTVYQNVGTINVGSEQFDSLAENHIFSSGLLNTARLSYSRTLNVHNVDYPAILDTPPYQFVYNQYFGGFSITSGLSGFATPGTSPQGFNQNLYSVSDDIYWTKGRHALQFGALLNRIEYYAYDSEFIRGSVVFTTIANFMNGIYLDDNVQTPGSNFHREPRFYTMGFYAQDDWRFNSRLTLNLGLRYEANTAPWDRTGANYAFRSLTDPAPILNGPPMQNASRLNFEPRFGLAWDVRGDGKTAVRAAAGVYDDVNSAGQSFYGPSAGSPPTSDQLTIANGVVNSMPLITAANALTPGTMPYGSAIKTSWYREQQPRLYQWNVSVQRQITPSVAVTAAYVGTKGVNLWDNEEGNPCFPSSVSSAGIPSWTPVNTIAPAGITTVFVPNVATNPGGPGVFKPNPAGSLPNPTYFNEALSVACNTVVSPGTSSAHFLTATYPAGASFPGLYVVPTSQNPLWGDWLLAATNGISNYNAGQLTLTKRASHGLEGQVAYTYSRTLDNAQGQYSISECSGSGGDPNQSQEPERRIFNYGPACFDIPQVMTASVIYHLPKTSAGGFVGRELLTGWWLANKTTWQVGFPFSPAVNNWRSEDQNITQNSGTDSEYINYGTTTVAPGQTGTDGTVNTTSVTFIPYNKNTVIEGTPKQWYNPLMFTMNPIGQLGTVHAGILRGPHYSDVDLSLNKDTAVPLFGEKGQLEFRIEAFNLFNHVNFAMPNYHTFTGNLTDIGVYTEAPNSTAGQITGIVGNPRQMQLSLKLIF